VIGKNYPSMNFPITCMEKLWNGTNYGIEMEFKNKM